MAVKSHWNKIYSTLQTNEASWYQPTPKISLEFIHELNIPATASVIDVGGGDSLLADNLLAAGFTDITILDISEAAINKAKQRLGKDAGKINWIISDINDLNIDKKFECWHDRAAFHFLTTKEEVEKYRAVAQKHITDNGRMIIGTFSTTGPQKCSGLPVKQYSEQSLSSAFNVWFDRIQCITIDHITPSKSIQNFLFCSFKKINFQ